MKDGDRKNVSASCFVCERSSKSGGRDAEGDFVGGKTAKPGGLNKQTLFLLPRAVAWCGQPRLSNFCDHVDVPFRILQSIISSWLKIKSRHVPVSSVVHVRCRTGGQRSSRECCYIEPEYSP